MILKIMETLVLQLLLFINLEGSPLKKYKADHGPVVATIGMLPVPSAPCYRAPNACILWEVLKTRSCLGFRAFRFSGVGVLRLRRRTSLESRCFFLRGL